MLKKLLAVLLCLALANTAAGQTVDEAGDSTSEEVSEEAGEPESSETVDNPTLADFKRRPTPYLLAAGGAVVAWVGFSGMFAGGRNAGIYCEDDNRREDGETEDECQDRINDENKQLVRVMGAVFGVGIVTSGIGAGMILWGEAEQEGAEQAMLRVNWQQQGPAMEFAWQF